MNAENRISRQISCTNRGNLRNAQQQQRLAEASCFGQRIASMKIRLQIIRPGEGPVPFEHAGPVIAIGRDPEGQLAFQGDAGQVVSWNHARIDLSPRGATLHDLNSTNGTFVNDQRVSSPVALRAGDQVRFGQAGPRLNITDIGAAEAKPKAATAGGPTAADAAQFRGSTRKEAVSSPAHLAAAALQPSPTVSEANRGVGVGSVPATGKQRAMDFQTWAGAAKSVLAIAFTDIVNSTALNNQLGNEEMDTVRRAHFRQGRKLLLQFGGYEIKTIGDSLMVALRTAVDAFNWSLALYRETGHELIKIRAGLHVGQVQIKEDDAFGAMVNYAARVAGQARGAEIWVSSRAKSDIDEERAAAHRSLRWIEHNGVVLKGFQGTHQLWSVEL
jgi:class 3 adenylate cyclase